MQGDSELQKTRLVKNKKLYIVLPIVLIIIVFLLIVSLFKLFTQKGNDMLPTIKSGASLVTFHYPFFQNFIHRDDVVLFKLPLQPFPLTVMRVIGLPGERVMLEGGSIYVDGMKLDESNYLGHNVVTNGEPLIDDGEPKLIPNNSYMVLGDNRQFSADSRTWGFVPKDNITGVVSFCLLNCK